MCPAQLALVPRNYDVNHFHPCVASLCRKMASEDALNHNLETKDMCTKCHLRLWGLEGVGGEEA